MYGFAPLYEIQKTVPENNPYVGIPHYGKFLHSFNYMGEAAVVLQLPFLCISLYANGYSYPALIFTEKKKESASKTGDITDKNNQQIEVEWDETANRVGQLN